MSILFTVLGHGCPDLWNSRLGRHGGGPPQPYEIPGTHLPAYRVSQPFPLLSRFAGCSVWYTHTSQMEKDTSEGRSH